MISAVDLTSQLSELRCYMAMIPHQRAVISPGSPFLRWGGHDCLTGFNSKFSVQLTLCREILGSQDVGRLPYLTSIKLGIHHLAPFTQNQRSHNPYEAICKATHVGKTLCVYCPTDIHTDLKARGTLSRQKTMR